MRLNLLVFDGEYIDQVVVIEERSYPNPWPRDLILAEFEKDVSFRLGLLVDGIFAAYSFSYLIPEELHLLNLAVTPELRGLGLGRLLLLSVLIESYRRGALSIILEVRASNMRAQNLYNSVGFRVIGCREGYYQDNNEDAFVLKLEMSVDLISDFLRQQEALLGKRGRTPISVFRELDSKTKLLAKDSKEP